MIIDDDNEMRNPIIQIINTPRNANFEQQENGDQTKQFPSAGFLSIIDRENKTMEEV